MSRLYFHSPSATAELKGTERAWLGSLVSDLAIGMMGLTSPASTEQTRLKQLIGAGHYLAAYDTAPGWATLYATSFRTSSEMDEHPLIAFEGHPIDRFTLMLNTATRLGNAPVKLAARLVGQCELHTWVDGPNRTWLAGIMQAGLDTGIFRDRLGRRDHEGADLQWEDQGWGSVIDLLRARDDEPVVTSFSVTSTFPDVFVGEWMPAWPEGIPYTHEGYDLLSTEQKQERLDREDAWGNLDPAEQWRISMAGLRVSPGCLELHPDNWADYTFGDGLTAFDLFAQDSDDRLRTALNTNPEAANR